MQSTTRRPGFTLVELLVVIAIIGVLVALLLPAVQAAREAARRSQCANNLKQIGLAAQNFESANNRLPAGSSSRNGSISGPYYSTWTVDLLPYMEQQNVYDLWNPEMSFSHTDNQQLRETVVEAYLCPSDNNEELLSTPESGPGSNRRFQWAHGSYRAMSGYSLGQDGDHYWDNPLAALKRHEKQMPLEWRGAMHTRSLTVPRTHRKLPITSLESITDGTSNTFLVGEYHTSTYRIRGTYWAYAYTSYNQSSAFPESRTLIADYLKCVQIGGGGAHTCKRGWGSLHAGGIIQYVFCDSSVRTVDPSIDVDVFVATATIQAEEINTLSLN